MSIRVSSTSLIAGAIVVGDPGLGVLAENVPSTGDAGAGYAYAYLSLPADNGKEVRGLIVTPPSAGTLTAYEDTSFVFGAPDGEYTFDWRLFVDGVDGGLKTETLAIGDSAPAAITGAMSVTESGGDTFAAYGAVLIHGTMDVTEAGSDTFAAYGGSVSPITGTMAVTEAGDDAFSATGVVTDTAPITAAEVARTISATARMRTVKHEVARS